LQKVGFMHGWRGFNSLLEWLRNSRRSVTLANWRDLAHFNRIRAS
jgi:hypothetical protein